MGVPVETVYEQVCELARQYGVSRVVLFGSRARKSNHEKSDIDLAIYGCQNFRDFSFDVNETVWTLLSFDLIDMNRPDISKDLLAEIERDGVVLYEKI